MKQVLIFLLVTLISKNSLTQELPSPGSYLINNNMGSFIGDWQWQSGSDTLKLYLRKEKIYFPIIGYPTV